MKKGFTLVELLAAIAVLAVLTIIVVPNVMSLFTKSTTDSMRIQENSVLDAANLFINDFCTHPVGSKKGGCSQYVMNPSAGTDAATTDKNRYVCVNTLQAVGYNYDANYVQNNDTRYLDNVYYKTNVNCVGFVFYQGTSDTNMYKDGKAYLQCGSDYVTEGTKDIKDKNGTQIITKCGGTRID